METQAVEAHNVEAKVVEAQVVKAKVLPQSRRPELYTRPVIPRRRESSRRAYISQ